MNWLRALGLVFTLAVLGGLLAMEFGYMPRTVKHLRDAKKTAALRLRRLYRTVRRKRQAGKSLVRSSIYMMGAQAVVSLSAFISSIFIAKSAGPDLAGRYGYLVWLGGTLTTVITLGVPNALTKFTAQLAGTRQRAKVATLHFHLMAVAVGASLVAAVAVALLNLASVFPASIPHSAIYTLAALLPLNAVSYSIIGSLRGRHLFNLILKWNTLFSGLIFAVLLAVMSHRLSMRSLTLYYVASSVLNFVIPLALLGRRLPLRRGLLAGRLKREVLQYIATVSAIILLDQVVWDKSEAFFLGQYSAASQIAFYTIAYTLTRTIMTIFPGAILNAMLPRIAELQGAKDVRAISDTYQAALRYVGMIVMAIAAGSIALATPFILGVYGQQYQAMVPVFAVLTCSSAWGTIVGVGSTVLYGMTKQTFLLKLSVWLAVANIIMDLLVIPRYGAIGAAISNAAVQGVGGGLTLYYLHSRLQLAFPMGVYGRLLACGGVASGLALLLARVLDGRVGHVGTLVVGGTVFVAVYSSLLVKTKLLQLKEVPLPRPLQTMLRRFA